MIPRARYTVAVNDVLVVIRTGWPPMAVPLLEQPPHEVTCEADPGHQLATIRPGALPCRARAGSNDDG
jgi:hypothetical protein